MLRPCDSVTPLTLQYLLVTVINLGTVTQQKFDHRVIILHGSNGQWCNALQHPNREAYQHRAHACLPETSVSALHHKYAKVPLRLHQKICFASQVCKGVPKVAPKDPHNPACASQCMPGSGQV